MILIKTKIHLEYEEVVDLSSKVVSFVVEKSSFVVVVVEAVVGRVKVIVGVVLS